MLGAALFHRADRLPLEIEDVEVVPDHHDLPEMKIAVMAALHHFQALW